MLRGRELFTVGGGRLQVIHPGRANSEGGPDFHHAIIDIKGSGLLRGDVEIHTMSSQWRIHGHHQDPGYNGVILHVVMWHDKERPTVLQSGKTVPVLPLSPYLELTPEGMERFSSPLAGYDEPCHDLRARLGDGAMGELLDKAGEERFRSKAAFFQEELAIKEGDQVLYEGLMRALGYSKNKEPFEELARRLPLRVLKGIAQRETAEGRGPLLQRALLEAAGLFPPSLGVINPMREAEWHLSGVRPCNMPQLRIAGAGYLLARYLERGLVEGVLRLVAEADAERGHGRLEQGVITRGSKGILIGRGRAREIVVNVLLPFSFAWAERAAQGELSNHGLELYRHYPRLEENQITREMSRQLFGEQCSKVVRSAQRQQGLIHLYKSLCLEGRCPQCPLGD